MKLNKYQREKLPFFPCIGKFAKCTVIIVSVGILGTTL